VAANPTRSYSDDQDPYPAERPAPVPPDVLPTGEVYDWYTRGVNLLEGGDSAAAAALLSRVAEVEPQSRSVREALARSQFDAGMYPEAAENFEWITEQNPADDYAQFGLGLAAAKTGDMQTAVTHLALAAAMRPDINHYAIALRGARAALAAKRR
jgi:Flp pilus assembly protein TadD